MPSISFWVCAIALLLCLYTAASSIRGKYAKRYSRRGPLVFNHPRYRAVYWTLVVLMGITVFASLSLILICVVSG